VKPLLALAGGGCQDAPVVEGGPDRGRAIFEKLRAAATDVDAAPDEVPAPAPPMSTPVAARDPEPEPDPDPQMMAVEPSPAAQDEAPAPLPAPELPPLPAPEDLELPSPPPPPAPVAPAAPTPATSPFARALPRVLAIANQKGGVGKTTTAVNLGASLASLDYRVLVIDLDPQGNASTGLGLNPRNMASSMYDVILHDLPLEDCTEPSSVRNLFVAPASLDLAGAEIELVPAFSRELRLKKAIGEVIDDYDFVVIDCPPSLGLLTVNGLAAATEVVVPIQCEYYALEGLGQLLRNVSLVQKNLNPALEVSALVCVMYDARTKLSDQVVQEVRNHFGDKVCRTVIPRTVRLSEAPSYGQPIITFDPSSRGAIAYRELAKEVSGGTPQRTR
jgi:chromosome partitioning protein